MNLEEGMYVRTSLGEIGKITSILNGGFDEFGLYGQFYNTEPILSGDAVKASHNIIDLIEVGDYVNGELVSDITNEYMRIGDVSLNKFWLLNNIKTILTKEQFEKNCYKVKKD